MQYIYRTSGTCAHQIIIDLEGDTVQNVQFSGGCNGNLKGISTLVAGQKATDLINSLADIKCGDKTTSCPDQLAKALSLALAEENKEQAI
jgi:uncharacterized protein (TIGR03905 family)